YWEEPRDVEVLPGLRHHPFVCGDDQQHEVDAGGAGQHVLNQALVAGDIDDPGPPAAGKVEVRKAEVDRHSPALFFLEPVGIDAGESLHQCALAVVDVACGADDEESTGFTIHDSLFALFSASTIMVSSPGSIFLMSNCSASSSILLNTGGRWARSACSSRLGGVGEVIATANEARCASGSDPPPTPATRGRTRTCLA